ncbi:hypothetical protein PIGHUM_01025 [Pigmentiphaga humi]|uniref:Small integral membrane protein n=1 Tax=Pigmentiphaga humi TaxID=2478468 RepID=A0A3P4B080_9BURK|nr:DUF2165 domain-containing protein [Pigmentiphaga humi]VCU68966.1 hypothetical protein PIGHUM_01025 [Pigmentiphaga humi]
MRDLGAASPLVRLSKTSMVGAVGLFATLAAVGNITDYGTNFAFVQHVLKMDTIFPGSTIRYRAIESPAMHHVAYAFIIAAEILAALLCWLGAWRMAHRLRAPAPDFQHAKAAAVAGLTVGFLLWQVGFMSLGGEWFGMWMSEQWNGIESAFRMFITVLGVLIYVSMRDD